MLRMRESVERRPEGVVVDQAVYERNAVQFFVHCGWNAKPSRPDSDCPEFTREGMSSTADLKQSGRSARYVFGLWTSIAVVCALSSLGGYALLGGLPEGGQSVVMAFAAGAILAMICDTMIPEAFRKAQALTGLVTVLGFVASYAVHQAG